jgi:repressor LexA
VNSAIGRETPIIGRIAAGSPILAVENIEGTVMLDAAFAKTGLTFLLKVKGTSMKDAGILDGDLVLVRQQSSAENGDIVAALINDEATVKYFKRRNTTVVLEPANSDFKPIAVQKEDQFSIVGKIIASLRIIDGTLSKAIFSKN